MSRTTSTLRQGLGESPRRRVRTGGAAPRRGVASVLAMLYLVIFSTLALGFYSAVTTSAQLAHNDERAMMAQVSAESGLDYVRLRLSRVEFPGNTPKDQVLKEVYEDLVKQLAPNAPDFNGHTIDMAGDTIFFPGGADDYFIPLDESGGGFRAEIVDLGTGNLRVKITGRYRGVRIVRAVELEFESVEKSSSIFDFGIVARGPIRLTGNGSITSPVDPQHANVLSLTKDPTPLTMTGNSAIGGDFFMTNGRGGASISGKGSVGGNSVPAARDEHIHIGNPNPEPELPAVDTSAYKAFATNVYKPGQTTYINTLVPANTNPNFSGGTTIMGVLYLKYPNKVHFSGQVTIRGAIVVENGASTGSGEIKFSGGATVYGMETLPVSASFPPALRALTGSALLAPGFDVTLTGQSGSIGGTMVADTFTLTGGSGGVINGTLIALGTGPLTLTGGADIKRTKPDGPIPAGLVFTKTFRPDHRTYLEVLP